MGPEAPGPDLVDFDKELDRERGGFERGARSWNMGLEAPGPDLVDFDKEHDRGRGGFEMGRKMLEYGPGGARPRSGRFG